MPNIEFNMKPHSGRKSAALLSGVVFVLIFYAAHGVFAATVTSRTNMPSMLFISGTIDARAVSEFAVLASRVEDAGVVYLDSPGSDVVSALEIGRIIRARNFVTDVGDTGTCASACIFILVAGVDRAAYGRIGIHRPRFEDSYFAGLSPNEAREKYNQLENATRDYLREMGITDELFVEMLRVRSDEVRWLTPSGVHALGIDGLDPAYEEWLRSQYAQRFGPDGYKRHLDGMRLMQPCFTMPYQNRQKCILDIYQRYPEAGWHPRKVG